MKLNQVTVGVSDVEQAIAFYETLGLVLIVHTHDEYARFECPDAGSTFSVHYVDIVTPGTTLIYFEVEDVDETARRLLSAGLDIEQMPTDQTWLWREARLKDPFGNPLCIYHAGDNRRFPPWRKTRGDTV